MAGLLWDKADARISNDELAEINEWRRSTQRSVRGWTSSCRGMA